MKTNRIISTISAIAIALSSSITALADEEFTMLTKEEILDTWVQLRLKTAEEGGSDGTTFPETSYWYAYFASWVEEFYGTDHYGNEAPEEWTDYENIVEMYADDDFYYRKYSEDEEYWHYNDDQNGNWTIELLDEDDFYVKDLYHFEYVDGMWNMIDVNGNIVDSFPPVNTLIEATDSESDSESDNSSEEDSESPKGEATTAQSTDSSARVTGDTGGITYNADSTNAPATASASVGTSSGSKTVQASSKAAEILEEAESGSASAAPYIIGGIAVVGAGAAAVILKRNKKKS